MNYQFNQPTPAAGAIQARRPYPKFSTIQLNNGIGYSNYHALQAKVERRFTQGLTFLAAYTFSKSFWPTIRATTTWAFKAARTSARRASMRWRKKACG